MPRADSNEENKENVLVEGEENFDETEEFEVIKLEDKVEIDTLSNHVKAWAYLEGYWVFIPERENQHPYTPIDKIDIGKYTAER